jgi:radical SAM superfamily enzyme YgiQ (UPF0313 family)
MKIILSYPPLATDKGCPTLGQNRQFQYFRCPTYIYPVVPAQAATLLKRAGHAVIWNDCIAEGWDGARYLDFIRCEKPDLVAFETKTPVVKQHWKIINGIKALFPQGSAPLVALFGDHVTALPQESFENSSVDFVLTGGDYDFLLFNLCSALSKLKTNDLLVPSEAEGRLATCDFEPGIYYRADGQIKNTGKFQLNHNLDELPFIDRDLTRWRLYAYKNGNYKRTPGTYVMSGRDCWWGKCSFCSWPQMYPGFRVRKPGNVLEEIEELAEKYGIREVMDDTGCFPAGEWLKDFCQAAQKRGIAKRVYLDCNMRFGALGKEDFSLMRRAGFRLLLFGLESANQATLDRINKGLKAERIIEDCRQARRAGLFPHITVMFGYPWENYDDALNTIRLGKWLLKKGYAYTMQATIVIPYPGTPLFAECRENGLLRSLDWDCYDMKQPVMKSAIADNKMVRLVRGMYGVSFSPEFIFRKAFGLRDVDDWKYALRAGRKVFGHLFDFKRHTGCG